MYQRKINESDDRTQSMSNDAERLKSELMRKIEEFRKSETKLSNELEDSKRLIDSLNYKLNEKDKTIAVRFKNKLYQLIRIIKHIYNNDCFLF